MADTIAKPDTEADKLLDLPEIIAEVERQFKSATKRTPNDMIVLANKVLAQRVRESMIRYYESKCAGGVTFCSGGMAIQKTAKKEHELGYCSYQLFDPPGGSLTVITHPQFE